MDQPNTVVTILVYSRLGDTNLIPRIVPIIIGIQTLSSGNVLIHRPTREIVAGLPDLPNPMFFSDWLENKDFLNAPH